MNPNLAQALQKVSNNINPSTGLGHPSDMLTTTKWLGEAIHGMEVADHPDEVATYLQNLGRISSEAARDVAVIYEALWCYIKGQTPYGS